MKLRDDHSFRTINDKRTFFGLKRNFAKVHFLLFDVANCRHRIFFFTSVPNDKANNDLEWRGVGHPPLGTSNTSYFGRSR